MKLTLLPAAALLFAGLTLGCEEADTPEPADPLAPAAEDVTPADPTPAEDAASRLQQQANDAGSAAKQRAEDAGGSVLSAVRRQGAQLEADARAAGEDVRAQADEALRAGGFSLDSLKEGMSLSAEQADGIIEQIKTWIGQDKLDTAAVWIDKLENVNLPEGYRQQIDSLRAMMN